MIPSKSRSKLREPCYLVLMCLLVCSGVWVSTQLSIAVGMVSSIWIGNGIISAFVLTAPRRWKVSFFLAGQLATMCTDLALGDKLAFACWFAVCNCSEVLVTVLPLRHFEVRGDITGKRSLLRIALFGLFLGPLLCAMLAAPAVYLQEGRPFLEATRIWLLADALGGAATLPVLLFLLTIEKKAARTWGVRVADILWVSALTAIAVGVFWQTRYPLLFLVFPPLVAALFRFRMEGAIYGAALIVVLGAAFTAEAHGPFALFSGTTAVERVILFQLFGLVVFAFGIPLGFSIEERRRLGESLRDANQKLLDLALLDSLTGVVNRRGFDAAMESEWSLARLARSELSLIYLDIDFFKRFNDAYGHQKGDDCLRAIARTLTESVRGPGDCVARYGGEEFVILLSRASVSAAHAIAARTAARILDLQIPHSDSPFGVVTASFGIAAMRPADGGNPDALIRLADEALYEAKRGGRRRIETKCEPGYGNASVPESFSKLDRK